MNHLPVRRGLLLIPFALACCALSPIAQGQLPSPTPDGGYPNGNTAEGKQALFSVTTGANNTAVGLQSLYSDKTGGNNTATGRSALQNNTSDFNTATGVTALMFNTGDSNTATGWGALRNSTTGSFNTANGFEAMVAQQNHNTGNFNTANGFKALWYNQTGDDNTAIGCSALLNNTTGSDQTANGFQALFKNKTGGTNIANGYRALYSNTTGNFNIANGASALYSNTSGSFNIALGVNAGRNLTVGSNNIDIGNPGVAGEGNTIRIGKVGTQSATFIAGINGATVAKGVGVIVDAKGHLGTMTSSERFKDEIKPMDKASEAILALKPVTFRYRHELDPEGIPQFGLVAEQVEKVNPDLVARDADGKVSTVRYEAVNAMLLNEFLKEHPTVQELKSTVAKHEAIIAQQQKRMEAVTAWGENQESQIEKMSEKVGLTSAARGVAEK
jgi:hypothetical protein